MWKNLLFQFTRFLFLINKLSFIFAGVTIEIGHKKYHARRTGGCTKRRIKPKREQKSLVNLQMTGTRLIDRARTRIHVQYTEAQVSRTERVDSLCFSSSSFGRFFGDPFEESSIR